MGAKPSRGQERLSCDEQQRVLTLPEGMWRIQSGKYAPDSMVSYKFLSDNRRDSALEALGEGIPDEGDRALGCLLGLVIGDALGSPLEFHPVRYLWDPEDPRQGIDPLAGFDPALWKDKTEGRETNRFMLEMGQWTDDSAMAFCLADSILANNGFHPRDLRLRFLAWFMLGYNNAFALDTGRTEVWGTAESIGIGGIVGESLKEFGQIPADYVRKGSIEDNGNGTIMRNAPVAIAYRSHLSMAMDVARCQSRTTHCGWEAADCARLLTWICVRAITLDEGKGILADLTGFPAELYSTKCLAASMAEERHEENTGKELSERDWNWRREDYRYAPLRAAGNPGYAGSYCMDCLAMALNCVYVTCSFEDALLRAANLCGDADTVAAVVGQLAGAIYGESAIPNTWLECIERWDTGNTRARAWLLFNLEAPAPPGSNEQRDGVSWTATGVSNTEGDEVMEAQTPMPLNCTCGRGFANPTLLQLHKRRCKSQ